MWKRKLCLSATSSLGLSVEEQIVKFREAGFEGFFPCYQEGAPVDRWARTARESGMLFQSIHAPFHRTAALWHDDADAAAAALDELTACLHACETNEIPLMIVHAFIGFDEHDPNPRGVERFAKLVKAAECTGVKIAFENTEGQEYLAALMSAFAGEAHVGFCWDSGHELCYNRSEDMLALYGSRLFGTHLNDNLGVRDENGRISGFDDLHLLPFDGITDWETAARRLAATPFDGPLTFELKTASKPGRHDNDAYRRLTTEEYLAAAYARACRVAALYVKELPNA